MLAISRRDAAEYTRLPALSMVPRERGLPKEKIFMLRSKEGQRQAIKKERSSIVGLELDQCARGRDSKP